MRRFWQALHWIVFKLRIYVLWSRIFRWLWQRKYRRLAPRLPSLSIDAAQSRMDLIRWRADNWLALGDAIDDPHRFEYFVREAIRLDKSAADKFDPGPNCDCDAFTAWGAKVIPGGRCLQVARLEGRKFWGHLVCLVSLPVGAGGASGLREFWHVGNWGKRGPFRTIAEAVEDVLEGKPLIGWALLDSGLHLIASGRRKLPPDDLA